MTDTILPHNATKLERELEGATSRISSVPLLIRESWNPDTCPVDLLPWLAWAFSVDEWRSDWTEGTKRQVINDAYNVQRYKGSVASVKTVLSAVGFSDGILLEGAAAGLTWAEFKVKVSRLLAVADVVDAIKIILATKPESRHLFSFDFTDVPLLYDGVANYDGTYTHGEII